MGGWLFLLTIVVAAWGLTPDGAFAAWALAAFLVPRLVVWGAFEGWTRRVSVRTWAFVVAAQAVLAGLAFVALYAGLPAEAAPELMLGAAGVMGFFSVLAGTAREHSLRARIDLRDLGSAVASDALVDRLGLFLGGAVTAVLLIAAQPAVAVLAASVALVFAAVVAFLHLRGTAEIKNNQETASSAPADNAEARLVARRIAIYLVAAVTTGAIGSVLLLASLPIAAGTSLAIPNVAPAFVAAAGLGMLIGPLPVPRLLLRLPAALLLLGTSLAMALAGIAIALTQSILIGLVAMVVFGIAAATQDTLRAVALRRLVSAALFARVTRLSLIALTVGQVYGAVGVVSVSPPDPFAILALLAVSQVFLVGLAIVLAGRGSLKVGGLSSLPIKSVVHRLSWETRPQATAADFTNAAPRARRLATWISRSANLEKLKVNLPITGREYEIYRPDDASRDRLFEAGRADPEKQMPYWAKVWPSGVALADVVVERKTEVASKHVLELGAGLGVTAAAVLEYGGQIVTADYSALPLAHCRLNTLVNTGRAPRATCFNWRHDAEVDAATRQPDFAAASRLILAADVLYEGRDAVPLLNVIERLLTTDGSLWLAEPVRRTAQRFLDSAAELGWDIESRQVQAEWPDATNGPVNVHFLTRSAEPDRITGDLGGFRI